MAAAGRRFPNGIIQSNQARCLGNGDSHQFIALKNHRFFNHECLFSQKLQFLCILWIIFAFVKGKTGEITSASDA